MSLWQQTLGQHTVRVELVWGKNFEMQALHDRVGKLRDDNSRLNRM